MIYLKIDKKSVRANLPIRPEYTNGATFKISDPTGIVVNDLSARPFAIRVVYPDWVLGTNYLITSVDMIGSSIAKVEGILSGSDIPERMGKGEEWYGIEITVYREAIGQCSFGAPEPYYVYKYKRVPKGLLCPRCESTFKFQNLKEKVRCPVCRKKLVKFEKFNEDKHVSKKRIN